MDIVKCPLCKTRVMPSRDGDCPSCRKPIPHSVAPVPEATSCPGCGVSLRPQAVLCVACGYHLRLQTYLATAVERATVPGAQTREIREAPAFDENPYAPPQPVGQAASLRRLALNEGDVRRAEAIASEGNASAPLLIAAMCCCNPLALAILPWYSYRLVLWYQLNAQYSELREPNSLSQYGTLALRFQDAKLGLWRGVILSAVAWMMFLFAVLQSSWSSP